MRAQTEEKNIYKTIGKISSYIVFPIILISFFTIFITVLTTPKNQMPQIKGYSIAKVLTSSMKEAGFNPGDVVFINQNKNKNLSKGDIVAFYKYQDMADMDIFEELVKLDEFEGEVKQEVDKTGRTTTDYLIKNNFQIYFHYVNEIYVAPDGTLFYQTKGSNPSASPDGFIRADYIVGTYITTPLVVRRVFSFLASTYGLILLVMLPLCILVVMESFNVINKVNVYLLEEKLFKREIEHYDPLIKKFKISDYMGLPRKAYYYINTPDKYKAEVFDLLYGSGFGLIEKMPTLKADAQKAVNILKSQGHAPYFLYWENYVTKKFDKMEVIKLKKQYEKERFIKQNNKNKKAEK
ncbi:MAG: S26 family signal peptidase [Christensenellales bacterium]|jgi:hypothetical protein